MYIDNGVFARKLSVALNFEMKTKTKALMEKKRNHARQDLASSSIIGIFGRGGSYLGT
jgi:hypothetical protein